MIRWTDYKFQQGMLEKPQEGIKDEAEEKSLF